jgi:hypothetical protein
LFRKLIRGEIRFEEVGYFQTERTAYRVDRASSEAFEQNFPIRAFSNREARIFVIMRWAASCKAFVGFFSNLARFPFESVQKRMHFHGGFGTSGVIDVLMLGPRSIRQIDQFLKPSVCLFFSRTHVSRCGAGREAGGSSVPW